MKINDKVFGEMEYDFDFECWVKEVEVKYGDVEFKLDLSVYGDEDGIFEQMQYVTYIKVIENWDKKFNIEPILEYYINLRCDLGYEDVLNEEYPLIETVDEMLKHIELVGIIIPLCNSLGKRRIKFSFACTWDEENGIDVYYINEKILDIVE